MNQVVEMQNIYAYYVLDGVNSIPFRHRCLVDAYKHCSLLHSGMILKALNKDLQENLECVADDIPNYSIFP